jgi:type IV pilus assembly protein PilA
MYKSGMTKISRGFTLVELLIVIAILAVLATATVVVLNPAELLAQARDTQRVTDMDTLKTALALYVASVVAPDLDSAGNTLCAVVGTKGSVSAAVAPTTGTFTVAANLNAGLRNVTGTGWVLVDFTSIPGGSPISTLPVDPTNTGDLMYRYACSLSTSTPPTVFELNAGLESVKFGGPTGLTGLALPNNDGGNKPAFYEVGSSLTL